MALSRKLSSLSMMSAKKMLGDLPPSSSVAGNQVVGSGLGDHAAGAGGAGEGDLGDALAGGQRHAGFAAKAVDDVEHAGWQQVGDQFDQDQQADGGGLGRLEHDAVAGANGGGHLPGRHQDGEVPGNDLAHDAQRFLEVVGHGVVVDLAQCRLPGRARNRRSSGSGRSASGMSALSVSRIGLPLSTVSA